MEAGGEGLCLEPIKVSTDSAVKYINSMQKYISGAFSNLEFYSHNFVFTMVIYWGDSFLFDYQDRTVLRTIRRDWVKFHSEKHEESRREKYPTPLAYLTSYECTAGSNNFSLKPTYIVPGCFPSPRQRQ